MLLGRQKARRFELNIKKEILIADWEAQEHIVEQIMLLEGMYHLKAKEPPVLRLVSYRI